MKLEIELSKVNKVKSVQLQFLAAQTAFEKNIRAIYEYAYEIGELLTDLKEQIKHGNWMLWICAKFPNFGPTDAARVKHAERCMIFFKRCANSTNPSNLDGEWDKEATRKLFYSYVPPKQRRAIAGDEKDNPSVHHLTWINNFHKWDNEIQAGLAQFPHISVLQHELEQPFLRIIEICGREWALNLLGVTVSTSGSSATVTFDSYTVTNGEFIQ